jgi:hypothetical protein
MLKRRRFLCGVLGLFLLGVLFCAGCGKKGDPIPPKLILPPAIADLTVASVAEGIALVWSVSEATGGRTDHFRIIRSEAAADQACPGCPQDYKSFVTLKVADQNLRREGEKGFGYIDATVAAGRFYSYRISTCDTHGLCGEPSAPAGVVAGRLDKR